MVYTPAVTLDLTSASPKTFKQAIDAFHEWSKGQPEKPLGIKNGWHTVDQELAERFLRRNPPGANRNASLAAAVYYAEQMLKNDWRRTGQPLIFTDKEMMIDGQHRCWAGYFTGKSFDTFIVADAAHFDNIFAYIDNGKPRTPTDALVTAGLNGLSSVVGTAVRLARQYDEQALTVTKSHKVGRLSPMDTVRIVTAHPELREAAHLQIAEYHAATKLIRFKSVAVFCAWKISEAFGQDILDEFMTELADETHRVGGSPAAALRKKLIDNAHVAEPMNQTQCLAYVIKMFNAWYTNQKIQAATLRVDEPFPRFVEAKRQDEAA